MWMKVGMLPRRSSSVCSLTAALVERKWCPRKHRQTQIDGRRVERVDGVLQIDAEGLVGIERPRDADQALREVGVDAPVAHGVGIGQRIARDRRANAEVIELGSLGAQTRFDVAQALAKSQLRERHAQKLIQAGERLHLALALIATDASAKRRQRKMLHQLREHQLALIHRSPPRSRASQGRRTDVRSSNRDQENSSLYAFLISNLQTVQPQTLGHY